MSLEGLKSVDSVKVLNHTVQMSGAKESGNGVSAFGTDIKNEQDVKFNKNPFNVYGNDIENFSKFKGKDKYDAMNATNKAAHEVNAAYKKFQKQYPGVNIEFPEPPNPANYGKRREGYHTYIQDLERWQNACNEAIEAAIKEQSEKNPPETPVPEENKAPEQKIPDAPKTQEPKAPDKVKTPKKTKKSKNSAKKPQVPSKDFDVLDRLNKPPRNAHVDLPDVILIDKPSTEKKPIIEPKPAHVNPDFFRRTKPIDFDNIKGL